jgi:pimeloyl-ACP methyl ester carboxylesterase
VLATRTLAALLVGVIVALAHAAWRAPDAGAAPPRSTAWRSVDCARFRVPAGAGSGVACGYVAVPLRHADPGGPTIQLATVVIPADAPGRRPDALFMAQGGPGGSTIDADAATLIGTPGARPVRDRDIVLWDQRGTLYSRPALLCPEVSRAEVQQALGGGGPVGGGLAPYEDCHERLTPQVGDLSAFNSAENADDVEDVRAALGYAQIDFYGASYGAEVGQLLMRQRPAHLRSVTLDAAAPLTYNLVTDPVLGRQRIPSTYFQACARESRCGAAFPDLGRRFLALLDRLDAHPATVGVAPLDQSDQTYLVRLDGTLMDAALAQALELPGTSDVIPLAVDRATRGDYTFISSLVLPLVLFDDTFAAGMYTTVACADGGDTDLDTVDYSGLAPRLAMEELQSTQALLQVCASWDIGLLPRADLQPVRSATPTLLLSGEYDPITPPAYATAVAGTLTDARSAVLPTGAHGQAVGDACASALVQRFVDDPGARLDTGCAAGSAPRFVTDRDVMTLPPLRDAVAAAGVQGPSVVALRAAPGGLGALLLLTAVPVYAAAWFGRRSRHRTPAAPARRDWTGGWARAAPWLAVAAGLVLCTFFAGLGAALGTTLATDHALIGLGAIGSGWRWLFLLPPVGALLVTLMGAAAVALWWGGRRSVAGRVYLSLLTLAGAATVSTLFSLGAMGLWRA